MTNDTITMTATIAGETREVECRDIWKDGRRLDSVRSVGNFQKRQGAKQWADRLTFWKQADGSYKLAQQTTILNRAGYRLIGWADKLQNASQHNSAATASA